MRFRRHSWKRTRRWRGEKPTRRSGGKRFILPVFNPYTWKFLPEGLRLDDKREHIGDPRYD